MRDVKLFDFIDFFFFNLSLIGAISALDINCYNHEYKSCTKSETELDSFLEKL